MDDFTQSFAALISPSGRLVFYHYLDVLPVGSCDQPRGRGESKDEATFA